MKKWTDDEVVIARNIKGEFKWISRDGSSGLYVYSEKPVKNTISWEVKNVDVGGAADMYLFKHMFEHVKWEDSEPTLIEDIIKNKDVPEPILTDSEREYLSAVIKPWRDRVICMSKEKCTVGEFIFFMLDNDEITLPNFKAGKFYKGMNKSKEYTLKELGL